jgi:uncharacterized protein
MIDYEGLRTLHHLLRQKSDFEDQLARCPRIIQIARAKSVQLDKAVETSKANWQKCQKDADGKQMTLRQREQRIEQMRVRRNACDSNKEFQILSEQIDADLKANSVLEDEILELLDRSERLHQESHESREVAAKGKLNFEQVKQETEARARELTAKIAALVAEIRQREKLFPGDFLDAFRRRAESNGPDALAETDGHSCGSCHSLLTTQILSELRQSKAVACKSCGAIMYMIEKTVLEN